jgi:prepilin-type N-terminal cleavage/methylation domain-containing protein
VIKVLKKNRRQFNGFTMVELMVAIVITGFITSAAATLAFAFSSANTSSDEISVTQAQVRFASLRLKELISQSKLVCAKTANDLVVWSRDINKDNDIDVEEVIYIETGPDNNYIQLLEFKSAEAWLVSGFGSSNKIGDLSLHDVKSSFVAGTDNSRTRLITSCSNVIFTLDKTAPNTEFVSISFDIEVNGINQNYQINAKLKCWAGNLISSSGILVSDDD